MNKPTLKLPDLLAFEMKDVQTEEPIRRIILGNYTELEVGGFSVCITDFKPTDSDIDWTALKYSGKDLVFFTDDKRVDLSMAMKRVISNILCYIPVYEPVPGFTHDLVDTLPEVLAELESIPAENTLFIKVQYQSVLSKTNLRDAHLD